MSTQLTSDAHLLFPDFTVCSASAGTGKTFTLTQRFLQFILSDRIHRNNLLNILAVTFTNNAASEMKRRIIESLKLISFGDEEKLITISKIVKEEKEKLRVKSEEMVSLILDNYSDFQVKTIDSFMASVFKATALEYGFNPESEIGVNDAQLLNYALDVFARSLRVESFQSQLFSNLIRLIEEQRSHRDSFLWNPYERISSELLKLYRISAQKGKDVVVPDSLSEVVTETRNALMKKAKELQNFLNTAGLPVSKLFLSDLRDVLDGKIESVLGRTEKDSIVNKPKTSGEKKKISESSARLASELTEWNTLLRRYHVAASYRYYLPYTQAMNEIKKTIERIKRDVGEVSLADVSRELLKELNSERVPEIYFSLGETIYHFLVDEFQDTSPVQWQILKPLIENSLSQGGSLFVVGDVKQSIYTFRGADWHIMDSVLRDNPFPAAEVNQLMLTTNRRSAEHILQFVYDVFAKTIPAMNNEYSAAAHVCGLSNLTVDVLPKQRGNGYVEVQVIERDDELVPEKEKILSAIHDCRQRGYAWRDIAVLSPRNNDVVAVSAWLNEEKIPFVSHSSLDIRKRKTIGDILSLLRFLDSPIDDFSFSTFLLSELYEHNADLLQKQYSRNTFTNLIFSYNSGQSGYFVLYRFFQEQYPELWKEHFASLFSRVGYLPLYDLVSEICRVFKIFSLHKNEEAAVIKFLEVVKRFEEQGSSSYENAGNSLRDFLEFVDEDDDSTEWELDAPKDIDAVSVMTVHKAKGLGFPVVLVLLYDGVQRGQGYIVEEAESGITLVRATKKDADRVETLKKLYEEKSLDDCVDYLNTLYVAFTRAMKEMYVVSVYVKNKKFPSSFFSDSMQLKNCYGKKIPHVFASAPQSEQSQSTYHHDIEQQVEVVEVDKLGIAETRRGDCFHLLLSRIEFLDDDIASAVDALLPEAVRESGTLVPETEVKQTVMEFFSKTDVKRFFVHKSGRTILNEQEFVRADGSLFRMDRIVVDDDVATIIDYKTGSDEKHGNYVAQVKNYIAILSDLFPEKTIKGVLAYIDMKRVAEVQ